MKQENEETSLSPEKREQLIFTYKPNQTNPDYYWIGLLRERKAERGIIPKQSILEAVRAFWMPIACLRAQKYSEDCLKQMFWESMGKLTAQQELLWNTVGQALKVERNLERPQMIMEKTEVIPNNNNPNLLEEEEESTSQIYSGCDYEGKGLL